MKKFISEFKEFINKGDVILTAVGLVSALYFKSIVDGFINGIINPLIGAFAGKESMKSTGITIHHSFFGTGLVIDAVIQFVLVSLVLFTVVKGYSAMQRRKAEAEVPAPPTETELLIEIRELLRQNLEKSNTQP